MEVHHHGEFGCDELVADHTVERRNDGDKDDVIGEEDRVGL